MKTILCAALGLALAGGMSRAMALTTADTAAPPGPMAAQDVANGRGTAASSHSSRKPLHRFGAPGQAASPSVSADKGSAGAPSSSAAPAKAATAPAEAAAPSVQTGR